MFERRLLTNVYFAIKLRVAAFLPLFFLKTIENHTPFFAEKKVRDFCHLQGSTIKGEKVAMALILVYKAKGT